MLDALIILEARTRNHTMHLLPLLKNILMRFMDGNGNLIGINFDRVWEGTMSDINYDPTICRNIMVDIRYVLFIVDKYANATHLINEMKLVHPKLVKKPA